jgi:hypothetical protein
VPERALTCGFVHVFVRRGVPDPARYTEFVSWIST